jgi:hypothetical protein
MRETLYFMSSVAVILITRGAAARRLEVEPIRTKTAASAGRARPRRRRVTL